MRGQFGLAFQWLFPRRVGREPARQHHQQHKGAEPEIDGRPARPRGYHQCKSPTRKTGEPIAELIDGRQKFQRRRFVRHFDAPSIDDDVLRGTRKGGNSRQQREQSNGSRRVQGSQRHKRQPNQRLDRHQPTPPAPQSPEKGHTAPINQRRPEEFEGVSEADEREDAHRFQVDAGFPQPSIERSEQQRVRQAGRHTVNKHNACLPVGKCGQQQAQAFALLRQEYLRRHPANRGGA